MKTLKFAWGWLLTFGLVLFLVGCLPDSTTKWYSDDDSDSGGGEEPTATAVPTEATETTTIPTEEDNVTTNKFPRFLSYTNRFLIPVESAAGFTYGSYVSSNKGSTSNSGSGSGSGSGGNASASLECDSTGTSFRGRVEEVINEVTKDGLQSYLLVRVECGTLGKLLSVLDNHYNFISPVTTTVPWPAVFSESEEDEIQGDDFVTNGPDHLLSTPLSYYRPLPVNLILSYDSSAEEYYPNITKGTLKKKKFGKDVVRYISEPISEDVEHLFKEMVVYKVVKDPDRDVLRYFGFVSAEQLNDGKDTNYPCSTSTDDNYVCLRPIDVNYDNDFNKRSFNFYQDGDTKILELNSGTIRLEHGVDESYADPIYMPGDDITTKNNNAVGVINKKEDKDSIYVTVEPGKVFVADPDADEPFTMNINPYGVPETDDMEFGPGEEGTNPHYNEKIHKKITLAKVINNRFFPLYVGEQFVIEPVLGQWANAANVTYEIEARLNGATNSSDLSEGNLVSGIKFDKDSGMIYGKPEAPMDRAFITVKATYTDTEKDSKGNSLTYSSYYTFEIRVYNVMEVVLDLDKDTAKNVTSYYFHKEGAGNTLRKCRITEDQIASDANETRIKEYHTNFRNIMCYLEGEEHDFNQIGYSLNINIGPGLCNYYERYPHFKYQWKPLQTTKEKTYYKVTRSDDCKANGTTSSTIYETSLYPNPNSSTLGAAYPPAGYYIPVQVGSTTYWMKKAGTDDKKPPVKCYGNYNNYYDLSSGGMSKYTKPSCDNGSYKEAEVNITKAEDKPCEAKTGDITTVNCNTDSGVPAHRCIDRSILESSGISGNANGEVVTSTSGIKDKVFVTTNGHEKITTNNRRVANFVGTNSCVHAGALYGYGVDDVKFNNLIYFREGWEIYSMEMGYYNDYVDPFRGGNPFNILTCLNAAHEMMAKIDVVVREWDRHFMPNYHLDYLDPDVKEAMVRDDPEYNPSDPAKYENWAALKQEDWRLYNTKNFDVWGDSFNDFVSLDNRLYSANILSNGLFESSNRIPVYQGCGTNRPPELNNIEGGRVKYKYGYCHTGLCKGEAHYEKCADGITDINEFTCRLFTSYDDLKDNVLDWKFSGWSPPQIPGTEADYYDFPICRDGETKVLDNEDGVCLGLNGWVWAPTP